MPSVVASRSWWTPILSLVALRHGACQSANGGRLPDREVALTALAVAVAEARTRVVVARLALVAAATAVAAVAGLHWMTTCLRVLLFSLAILHPRHGRGACSAPQETAGAGQWCRLSA